MSRPYQFTDNSDARSPLDRKPASPFPAGQPVNFQVNVNRNKTKRWVEAPSYSYDGDDYGDYDDDDPYETQRQPPAPQQPTGLRQKGQGIEGSSRNFTEPRQGAPLDRRLSFDQGDERRTFSAGTQPPTDFGNPLLQSQAQNPPPQTQNYAPGPQGPASMRGSNDSRQVSSASFNPSVISEASSGGDPQQRRDFSPSMMPPPLGPRASPAPVGQTFPARKSSLSQGSPAPTPHLSTQTSVDHPSATPSRDRAPSNPSPARAIIRPADIYKRMEEERERERQSMDSSRPSMDSITRAGEEGRSSGGLRERTSSDSLSRASNRRPSLERLNDQNESGRIRSPLATVAERKSEYLPGFTVTDPALARAIGADLKMPEGEQSVGNPTAITPSQSTIPTPGPAVHTTASSGAPSLALPTMTPVSEFGQDLWPSSGNTPVAERSQPSTEQQHAQTPLTNQAPTPSSASTLQHQPSAGFRSAVNHAFERTDDSSAPPTPISKQNSNASQWGSGVSRSNTDSTAGISPIMSRVPSAATAEARAKEAQERATNIPAIAEEDPASRSRPLSAAGLPNTNAPLVQRKPSPSHSRNVSAGSTNITAPSPHRKDLREPSPGSSPARSPHVETPPAMPEPKEAEVGITSPMNAHGGPAESAKIDFATREADLADRVNRSPPKDALGAAQAAKDSPADFLQSHQISPAPALGSSAISRAESPSKGKVRGLADRFNADSRRNSGQSLKSVDSWERSHEGSPVRSGSPLKQLSADRPPIQSEPSFRPKLPGQWESYATTPAETPTESDAERERINASIPPHQIKEADDNVDLTPTTARRSVATEHSPSEKTPTLTQDPIAALAAAGQAMGDAIKATAGYGDNNYGPEKSRSIGDVFLRPLAPDRMESTMTEASTIPPTPPPKDDPLDHAPNSPASTIKPPAPLKEKHASPATATHSQRDITPTRPTVSTQLSTDYSDQDEESDRLRKDIVRSLSPLESSKSVEAEAAHPSSSLAPTVSAGVVSRDSSFLPSEYDSYWAAGPSDRESQLMGSSAEPIEHDNRFSKAFATSPTVQQTEADPSLLTKPDSSSRQTTAPPHLGMLDKRFSWEDTPQRPHETVNAAQTDVRDMAVGAIPPHASNSEKEHDIADAPGISDVLHVPTKEHAPLERQEPQGLHVLNDEKQETAESPVHLSEEVHHIDDHALSELEAQPPVPMNESSAPQGPRPMSGTQQQQSGRIPPFREILAIKSPQERINAYNKTRQTFADMDTGLSSWITATMTANPEHGDLADIATKPAPNFASSTKHKYSPSIPRLRATSLGAQQSQSGGVTSPTGQRQPGQQAPTPTAAGSAGRVQGKDLLKQANIFGGKASAGAKGLFAKAKSRAKGGSEKAPPQSSDAPSTPLSNRSASRSQTWTPETSTPPSHERRMSRSPFRQSRSRPTSIVLPKDAEVMSNFSRGTPQAERSRPQSYAQQDVWDEQLPAPPKLGQSTQDRLGVLPSPANESFDVSETEGSKPNENRHISEEVDDRLRSIIKHSGPIEEDDHSTKQLPKTPEVKTQPSNSFEQNAPTTAVRSEGETEDVSPIEPATRHSLQLTNRDTSLLDPSTAHHADQSPYPDPSHEESDISPVVSNLSRNISVEQRQRPKPHTREPDSAARDKDDPLMRHIGNGDISPIEPSKDDTADSLPLARTMSGRPISSVHFAGGLIMPSAKPPQILETVEPKSERPVSQATNTFDSPTLRSAKLAVPGRTDTPESWGHSSAAESEPVVSQAEAVRTERVGSALEVEANSPIEGKRNPLDRVDEVRESVQDESIDHSHGAATQVEKSTALVNNDNDKTSSEDHAHAQTPAANTTLQLPTDDDDLYAEPSYMPKPTAAAQDPVKVPSAEGNSFREVSDNMTTTEKNLSGLQLQHEQQVARQHQQPLVSAHLPVEGDTMHTRQPSQVSSLHEPRTPPSTQADRLREQQPMHHRQFSFESQGSPGQQRLIQQSGVMTQQRPPSFVAMPRDQFGRPAQEMISTGRGQPVPQQEQFQPGQSKQSQEQTTLPQQQHGDSDPRLMSPGNEQDSRLQGTSVSQDFRDAGPGLREVNQGPLNREHDRSAYDPRTGRDEFSLPGVGPPSALQQSQGRGRGSVLQSISSRVSSAPPVQNPPGLVNSRVDPRRVAPQYDRQFSFQSSAGGSSAVGSPGESQQAPEEKENKRRSGFFRSLSRPGSMSSSSEASTRAQAAASRVDLGSSQSPRPTGQLSRPPSGNNRLTKQAPETQVQRAASSGVADQGKSKRFSSLKAIFGRAGTTGHSATPKANKLSKVEPSASVRKRQEQEQAQQWHQSIRQQSARQPYHQPPPTGAYAATSGYNPVPTPPATQQRPDAFSGYKQPSSTSIATNGTQPSGPPRAVSSSTQPTAWPLQQRPDTTVIRDQGGIPPPPGGYYAPGTTEGIVVDAAAAAAPAPARASGFSHQRGASGHAAIEQLQTRRDSSPYESMVQMQNRPSIQQHVSPPGQEPNYEQPAIPAAYLDRAAQSAQLQSYWGRQYNPSLPSSPVHYPPPAQAIPMQQQQRAQSPPNPAYPPHAPIHQHQQQYPPRRESVQSFGNPMSPQISNPTLPPGHRYSQESRAYSAGSSSIHSPVSPYSQRGPNSEPMPPSVYQQSSAIPRPQQQQQQYQQPPPRMGPVSGGVNADRDRRIQQHQERPWAITLPTETLDERTEARLRYEEAKESAMCRSPHSPKPPMNLPTPVLLQGSQNQLFPAQRNSQQMQQQLAPQHNQQPPQHPSQQPVAGYREASAQIQHAAPQGYKEVEPQESPQDHIPSLDSLRAPPSQQSNIHSPQPQQHSTQHPPQQQHLSPLQTQQAPQQAANHRTSLSPHSQHGSPHDAAATRRQSQSPHLQNPPSPAYLAHLEQTQKFPGRPPVPSGHHSPHHLPPVDTNTGHSPSTVPLPASANSASPYSANAANVPAPPPPQLSTRNLAAISNPYNYNAASPHAVRQAHPNIPQQHPGRRSNPASPTSPSQQSTSTSYPSTEPPAYTGPNANPIAENDDDLYAVDSPVSDRRPGGAASRTRHIEDDDAPVMMGASYPGDEWVPEWDGRD